MEVSFKIWKKDTKTSLVMKMRILFYLTKNILSKRSLKPSMKLADMKDRNKKICGMDQANFIIKMEAIMMETGNLIKCMGKVSYTTRVASWHMKDSGEKIAFMDLARYSTKNRSSWTNHSPSPTLISSRSTGNDMKVDLIMTRSKEREN